MRRLAQIFTITLLGLFALTAHATITLTANGSSGGSVTVNVGEAVYFQVVATNCAIVNGKNAVWRDNWKNAGTPEQEIFNSSPCSVPSFGRNFSFSAAGTYTVSFTSEYCKNLKFSGCKGGGWQFDQRGEVVVTVLDPLALTCFTDTFSGSGLNPDDWITSVSNGAFTPGIASNGRLRMTEAVSNQATAATLQREIPGADNLVVLEFDYYAYGGNGADGLAVVLSDATVTPQPGSYGGSLGYAQRNNGDAGFAGGWLGIGLDEYGNFANPTEGRIGGPGLRKDSVTLRGAAPDYRYLAGTGTLNPGIDQPNTSNPSPQRYRITVDSRTSGQAIVSVERDVTGTGSNYQMLVAPFDALSVGGQPAVPANFLLSLTGSTGGANNIHELDNVQLCALQLNTIGAQVDHFEIIHDGVALTCQPETVTIKACANADCSTTFTDPVVATMKPSGWVGGDTVSLVNGYASAAYQQTSAGPATLGVVGSVPSTRPQSTTLCQNGSGSKSAANCEIQFRDSGLAFDVPSMIANQPTTTVKVSAVQRSDETNACVPAFANVSRDVSFWSDYVDPAPSALQASRQVVVNGQAVARDQASASTQTLTFDSNGQADIVVRYPDAGLMTLNALYRGSAGTADDGLLMPGADGFVSRPAGFCVQTDGDCSAGDSSCPVFKRAGESFELRLRAMAWESAGDADLCAGNGDTPNFSLDNVGLSHSLISPSPTATPVAGQPGTVGRTAYDHQADPGARQTVVQTVSEVGVFRFSATPLPGSYFGQTVAGGQSAPVGRFIPDHFDLSVIDLGTVESFCSASTAFAYLGQELNWLSGAEPAIGLTARTVNDPVTGIATTTRNYTIAPYQRLNVSDLGWTPDSADASALAENGVKMPVVTSLDAGSLAVSAPGQLTYRFAPTDAMTYEKSLNTRVTPFSPDYSVRLTTLSDQDGVSSDGMPFPLSPQMPFEFRYGRLALENAYGPETMPLTVPLSTEYFDGSRFVINTDDSCWQYDTSLVTLAPSTLTTINAVSGTLSSGQPSGAGLVLAAPGTGSTGDIVVTYPSPRWLQDDYDLDGTLADPENPTSLATFGVYRGHDRVIYWREK